MHETVSWSDDNCPRSVRFDDVYRSRSSALLQSQTVFVGGCRLPQRWAQAAQFCILETGFGLGLNFLATWRAWLGDAQRCGRLH
jgi:tRNA 5-methylaminomethyl-2-thiouridine biosynthesis bifunctional protein